MIPYSESIGEGGRDWGLGRGKMTARRDATDDAEAVGDDVHHSTSCEPHLSLEEEAFAGASPCTELSSD